jgi:shikimate kinase
MTSGPIWLVGMMGAGKSAIGPPLARRLGRLFVDSDAEIERSMNMTVAEIFESLGEPAFRTCERETIESLREGNDVVALGGGAIAQPGAVDLLGHSGSVVYLSAGIPTLIRRLGDCATRPLLRDLNSKARTARLTELLETREAAYRSAALVVATDGVSVRSVVDEIVQGLDSGPTASARNAS